jgi:CheY-like chemotaxis protein
MSAESAEDAIRALSTLAQACARLEDPDEIVATALPTLAAVAGADAGICLGADGGGPATDVPVTHRHGLDLPAEAGVVADAAHHDGDLCETTVPGPWREAGIERAVACRLAGGSLVLALAWRSAGPGDLSALGLGLSLVGAELSRTASAGAVRPENMEEFERRKALEINDNVVQGLVAASYALDQGQVAECAAFLNRTLASARAMMDGMLEPDEGHGLRPGDLVRSAPAHFGTHHVVSTRDAIAGHDARTVLVVDDADDLRMLLRSRMEGRRGLTVVGEAADGLAAVELASELQPDLVMLDLAMPRMDGLEALPLIRAAVPGVRVIVLSGFNQNALAEKAMQAGADRYVIKGGSMRQLLDLVDSVLQAS